MPRSSCKCPVQSLLCPPPHSTLYDIPPLSCPAPTISTPRSRRHRAQKLGRKDQRARVPRSCPSPSPHARRGKHKRASTSDSHSRLSPQLQNLLPELFYTRPNLLPSPPLSPTPSHLLPLPPPLVRPSTCLPLPLGRATAARITPAVTKIKKPRQRQPNLPNIMGTNPMGRSARIVSDGLTRAGGSHLRPVETTHRPLCGRLRQLHNRAMMTVFAPSVAHLPSGPSPGN